MELPRLILRSDLDQAEALEIGWSAKYVAEEDRARLRSILSFEIRIEGLDDDDDKDDAAMDRLRSVGERLCDGRLGRSFLLRVGSTLEPRSRVRLHKGLFGRRLEGALHRELDGGDDLALLVGMVELSPGVRRELLESSSDYFRSCVISCRQDDSVTFADRFFDEVKDCLDVSGVSVHLAYRRLIPRLCHSGRVIWMFQRDHRGESVNIAGFLSPEVKDSAAEVLQQTVQGAAVN